MTSPAVSPAPSARRPPPTGPERTGPFHSGRPGNETGATSALPWRRLPIATGETGFADVTFDLISVQYHSLKAGHDYGQYVRDAENAGLDDIAGFFREVMDQDSARAKRCHEFLGRLTGTDQGGPAAQ